MLRFELVVESGSFFETFDHLGVDRVLEFSGHVISPSGRFAQINRFELSIQVKNSRSDILGQGRLNLFNKTLEADVFLTQADVQNLSHFLPSLSGGDLSLSFMIAAENKHEIFGEHNQQDIFEFQLDEFVKALKYENPLKKGC